MKCPRCGSKNIAKIMYGLPAYDEELEAEVKAGEVYLGGCKIGDTSPKFHCNDCKRDFGTPPLILSAKKDCFEDLRDVITSIHFSDGGYFGGYQDIRLKIGLYRNAFLFY